MPTRRTFDLIILVGIALHLGGGVIRGWAARKAAESPDGSAMNNIAKAAEVIF